MWSKKRDEERFVVLPADKQVVPAAPVPMSPSPMESKKEALPVSSMPLGGRIKPENIGSATIGKAVKVVGQIYSKEDLIVDGDLEGTAEALEHKLTIGPNGTVHADLKAREVAVLGSLQGDVEATDKIEIRKGAKLVGNIKTARILIEDGAYFKGGIDVVKAEPKAAPEAQQSTSVPPSAGPVGQLVHAPSGLPKEHGEP